MADLTKEELDQVFGKLIRAIDKNTGTAGKLHKSGISGKSDTSTIKGAGDMLRRDLGKTVGSVTKSLRNAGSHFDSLGGSAHGLRTMFEGILALTEVGVAIKTMIKGSEELAITYRKMMDVGQGFNGSMLEMGAAAAAARMPLEDFAKMMENFSTSASVLNVNAGKTGVTLGSLQLGVRDNLRQYGMLGMSLSDISDMTGRYTETMRLQGHVTDVNNTTTVKSVTNLAKNITDFAAVTGVSRDKIRDITFSALQDAAITSKMRNESNEAQRQALETGTAFLASMPGKVGETLATMLTQSVGYGSVYLSDSAKDFMEAGAQDFVGVMDDMKTKIDKGQFNAADQGQFLDQMQSLYSQQSGMLHMQAASGNGQAKQFIQYMDQLNGLSKEQFEAQNKLAESTQSFTKFILLIDDTLERFSGSFRQGFFDAIKGLEDSFKNLQDSGLIDQLTKGFGAVGKAMGELVMLVFSPENMTRLSTGLETLATWLQTFPDNVGKFYNDWAPVVSEMVTTTIDIGKALFYVGGKFVNIIEMVHSALSFLPGPLADVGTALVTYLGYKAIKGYMGGVADRLLGRTTEIKANIVNVNGRNVGGGSSSGLGGLGRASQAGLAAEETAAKAGMLSRARSWATKAAEGGMVSKILGKSASPILKGLEGLSGIATKLAPTLAPKLLGAAAASGGMLSTVVGGTAGIAAIAGIAGKAVVDMLPKFKGQDTIGSMISGGATGAGLGSFLGPLGTLVGGVGGAAVGGIMANLSSIMSYIHNPFGSSPATPGAATPINPTTPSSGYAGPEVEAMQSRIKAITGEEVSETSSPMTDRAMHEKRMADLQEEMTRCLRSIEQLHQRTNDHLRKGNDQARQAAADQ